MSNETVGKKEFLAKWKEVQELMLVRSYIRDISIVTDNENDHGLTDYEQSRLDKGQFPNTLYAIEGRINGLFARFEQWLEERASLHVMINQLLHYKICSTVVEIADMIKHAVYFDPDKDQDLQFKALYKNLINVRNKNRSIHSIDIYTAVHELWYMKVRIPIAEGNLEAQSKVEPFNWFEEPESTETPESTEVSEVPETPETSKKVESSVEHAMDRYYSFLEDRCQMLNAELNAVKADRNAILITLGKYFLTTLQQ